MKNKLQLLLAVFMFFAASQAFADRGRVVARWVQNTSTSCVDTCGDRLQPVSTGYVSSTQFGDPNLYLCKASIPGLEVHGVRAGYNWNGGIGRNVQPGCTVVGGRVGYSHAQSFHCLCESGVGIIGGDRN